MMPNEGNHIVIGQIVFVMQGRGGAMVGDYLAKKK